MLPPSHRGGVSDPVTLAHDWKAIKPKPKEKGKRKVPSDNAAVDEIHEDWLALRGGRHPAYAYIVRWEYPTAFAIFKVRVIGKRKLRHGTEYLTRGHSTVYKTLGMEIASEDKPSTRETSSYPRGALCFTIEDVDKHVSDLRLHHIEQLRQSMARFACMAAEVSAAMSHTNEYLTAVRNDPVPYSVRFALPKKESRKTRA